MSSKKYKQSVHLLKQSGFTLLELLIAMMLMLVVVIGVQRYIAGVVVDQSVISERHDQVSQTRIVLSNIQRDVAGAGYYPFIAETQYGLPLFTTEQKSFLGVRIIPCNTTNCQGQQLEVGSIQPIESAKDCNGDSAQLSQIATTPPLPVGFSSLSAGQQQWVLVFNRYSVVNVANVGLVLTCDGNGGNGGRLPYLDNINEVTFSQQPSLVSVCVITNGDLSSNDGSATTTNCAGSALPPAGRAYFKTRIDMPIYSGSFAAGS